MPCLLLPNPTVAPSLIGLDVIDISPPPLLILFEDGFIPIGLFSGTINSLSREWPVDNGNCIKNLFNLIVPPGRVEVCQCLKLY